MAADTANVPASTKNGSENATASRNPPSGGPMKELVTISAPHRRPLAFSRLSLLDDRRHQGLGGVVPEHLRHPEQGGRDVKDGEEDSGLASAGRPRPRGNQLRAGQAPIG